MGSKALGIALGVPLRQSSEQLFGHESGLYLLPSNKGVITNPDGVGIITMVELPTVENGVVFVFRSGVTYKATTELLGEYLNG